MFGKTHSEKSKSKISKSKGTPIEVLDLCTGEQSNFFSMTKAAKAIGCAVSALTKGFKKTNPYIIKKRFKVEKKLIN